MENNLKYVVLQKGSKKPTANSNGGWLLTEDPTAYDDVGLYLNNIKDVVVVDFDSLKENNEYEDKIIEVIQKKYPSSLVVKTDKGYHLYYKTKRKIKNRTKTMVCLGIKVDFKVGNSYTVIKRNGKFRQYNGDFDFTKLNELPDILLPLPTQEAKIQAGITEGARNDSLFHHLCRIRKFYDDVNLSETAHFINQYLYNPPMETQEVEGIVASSLKQNIETFEDDKSAKFYEAIENVIEEYKVHLANNNLYFLYNGHYENDDFKLLKLVYNYCSFSISNSENVIFQLKMKATPWDEKNIIAIKNGIIENGVYKNISDVFTPFYIDVTYDPNAYSKVLDDFIQFITNNQDSKEKNDLRIVLEEMFGHCLMFDDFPHKIFLLVGKGNNGKSVLLNFICNFFQNMYSSVPINYIDKDNYVARIVNKLVNISDDVDYNYLVSSQNIKKIASGDHVSARELYGKSFDFKSTCTQIYSMNELIKFKDKSYGMERRLCIIPFKNEVKDVDPHMLKKLLNDEAKSYFLNLALEGIKRIKENNCQLSKSTIIEKTIKRYINESDTVEMFFNYGDVGDINERQFSIIYEAYKSFCIDNEYIPCTKNGFSRRLHKKGYTSVPRKIDNKSVRMIIREDKDE